MGKVMNDIRSQLNTEEKVRFDKLTETQQIIFCERISKSWSIKR